MNRRLALVWVAAPLALYAWACSSDDSPPASDPDAGATSSTSSSSSSGGSSSGDPADAGEEAGDDAGNPLTCVGNPLTEDGGTPDGGVVLSADAGPALLRTAVATLDTFVDGPVYTDIYQGGALVYSEVFGIGHRVMRVGPDGGVGALVVNAPGDGADQGLVVGNAIKGTTVLTTVVPQGNAPVAPQILQTIADGGAAPPITFPAELNISDPNDLVVTAGGVVFFTDPGFQSGSTANGVYRVLGDGGVTEVKAYTAAGERPDGIALSPDEKTLYVSLGINQRIDRFTLDADGNATAVAQPFPATFTDQPEGLATDSAGNLWVAESPGLGTANGGRVSVWDPAGNKWGEIRFPNHRPIGVAFGGGADNKALYIAANHVREGGGTDAYVFIYSARCSGTR
jgi:sugar lactone lactonase YvrE